MKLSKRNRSLSDVRNEQRIPGVIYGREMESTPIEVAYKDFIRTIQSYGKSMTFEADLDGETHQVYFKEVQTDPLRQGRVLHFDLHKVSASDTITAEIPVEVLNREEVEARGLVVELIAQTVETEFPVGAGISSFEVDVEGLDGNETLTVADLDLPEGFKVLIPEDRVIVSTSFPQEEEEEEVLEEEEEDLEVEAIKQKDEDEEEESASEEESEEE